MFLKKLVVISSLFFSALVGDLAAAPKLRLSTTAVGPVVVSQGATGAASVDISNAGDGAFNLTAASSVPWIVPTVSGSRLQLSLQTASLSRGLYTGLVTVNDPNALDAPQTVTVTVQVGSAVPDKADFFAAPNGSPAELHFITGSKLNSAITTQSGGQFLALALEGGGSFQFAFPYKIVATPLSGLGEGTYTGSIVTSGSTSAADNKTIPVTLRITSQPIAQLSADSLRFRLAQNGPAQTQFVTIANRGLGSLSITGVTPATTSGGSFLTAAQPAGFSGISVTANPANLAPGSYQGTVTVASNAANGPITIPVQFDVVAQGPPVSFYQGVVNNATFQPETVAQGDIVALFGDQLTMSAPQQASSLPLATTLGDTRVFVNDQPAPVYYTSYNQINFQIPYEAATGAAVVRVERGGQRGNSISLNIARAIPRVLRLGIKDYGIIVNQDGSFPIPATPGVNSHPAKVGDTLVIYALGLGQTTPSVTSGTAAPSSPLALVTRTNRVIFGGGGGFFGDGVTTTPFFVGLTPGFVGLYQINVVIPDGTPSGSEVGLLLSGDDGPSNRVTIAVQ